MLLRGRILNIPGVGLAYSLSILSWLVTLRDAVVTISSATTLPVIVRLLRPRTEKRIIIGATRGLIPLVRSLLLSLGDLLLARSYKEAFY